MAEAFFIKINGAMHPASEHDREMLSGIKQGTPLRMSYKKVRNYDFHKKYFALLNFAFSNWEPHNEVGEKNFDQFREDIIILAGFYHRYIRLDSSTRIKAKSISFGSMDETEFSDLYDRTIEVICKHVITHFTGEQLKATMDQLEAFE